MKKHILYFVAFAMLGFASCKKDKTQDPEPANPATPDASTGTFMFHLHNYIENQEVDAYNIVYTTDEGRKISISKAQFYLSHIQLVKTDGSVVDFGNKKVLKTQDSETYFVGTAPVGSYKTIRFRIGLDSLTNLEDPLVSADSALLNHPDMWFGATAQPDGYVFMNVQGKIDTTADASGTNAQMQPFVFRIGTNAHYKLITMPDKPFSIEKDQVQFGHILVDYNRFFAPLQLSNPASLSVVTPADNSSAAGTAIYNALSQMFIYEE